MEKIMIDSNIYDKLYFDKSIQTQVIEYIKSGRFKLYSTPIQKTELEKMPDDKTEKKLWSLQFLMKWTESIPSLFAFDTEGAGFDQGRWSTPEEIVSYNEMDTSHIMDRNISIVASSGVDIFITEEIKLINKAKKKLPTLKVWKWCEFVQYLTSTPSGTTG